MVLGILWLHLSLLTLADKIVVTLFLSLYVCVTLSRCVFLCVSLCRSLSLCLSLCPSLSVSLSLSLSVSLSLSLSLCLFLSFNVLCVCCVYVCVRECVCVRERESLRVTKIFSTRITNYTSGKGCTMPQYNPLNHKGSNLQASKAISWCVFRNYAP